MSSTAVRATPQSSKEAAIAYKLEAIVIPVSDVDRAKNFYVGLGWRVDADFVISDALRLLQLTPPGSPCSIHFGKGLTAASPGSAQGMYLVVSDIEAARADLISRGAKVSELFHRLPGQEPQPGLDPKRQTYSTYATFDDPDGNRWLLQEVTRRLPGRVDPGNITYTSASDIQAALWRAALAHGEHEKKIGGRDENWPEWYAAYMASEATGTQPPA